MAIVKKLEKSYSWELRDHRNNTAWELIKCYTLNQLSFMDWIDTRTVKSCGRYLPVRVDSWPAMDKYRRGKQMKPYRIMWIRLDEIKDLFNKMTHKKLVVEIN